MSDGIQLMLNEDGKAEIYDDTWDIVIHCENEKEFNEAKEKILSMNWIPVTERLPEYGAEVLTINTDGDYEINHVIDEEDGEWFFDGAVAWMSLPEPWKGEEVEFVKQKTGRWDDYTCMNWHGWHCSECDYETQNRTNYCPNCGARMSVY